VTETAASGCLTIPRAAGDFDEYVDINKSGEIVGFYIDDHGFTTTGFLRSRRGRFASIDVPDSLVR
jgi:hypothetical protein